MWDWQTATPVAIRPALLDQDDIGLNQANIINLIDSKKIEHDFFRKVRALFGSCSRASLTGFPGRFHAST
jgi:hypothetical protein